MSQLNLAVKTLIDNGLTVPQDVADALAVLDALNEPIDAAALHDELRGAIVAGTVKPGDVASRLAAVAAAKTAAEYARPIANELTDFASRKGITALRASQTAVIDELRPVFDQAVAIITAAVEAGIRPTTSAAEALERGAAVGAAFAALPDADEQLRGVMGVWFAVTGRPAGVEAFLDIEHIRPPRAITAFVYATAGEDIDRLWTDPAREPGNIYSSNRPTCPAAKWVALVANGVVLRLNTAGEARAAKARADEYPADAK